MTCGTVGSWGPPAGRWTGCQDETQASGSRNSSHGDGNQNYASDGGLKRDEDCSSALAGRTRAGGEEGRRRTGAKGTDGRRGQTAG